MSRIETGLHAHHAAIQNASTSSASTSSQGHIVSESSNATDPGLIETPFAKVNSVVAGSPAADAGLQREDRIRRFGDVNWINHEKLAKVAETVQRNEGVRWIGQKGRWERSLMIEQRCIVVKVVRGGVPGVITEELQLQLTPRRNWGGRGLLGCYLLPA